MNSGTISYAQQGPTFVLKFAGDIRYTMGCSLDNFLKSLFARDDFDTVLIDLSDTESIDSTSLGLLAKIANFMRQRFHTKPKVVSPNEDVNQVLDSMGFDEVFDICRCEEDCPDVSMTLKVKDANQGEMKKILIDAHKALCDMNDQNRLTFKNVVEVLENAPKSADNTS